MSGTALLEPVSALEYPRQSWKVAYPLPDILLTVLSAVIAGADDFVEIERWARRKIDFLPFEKGTPSHDTLTTSSTRCRPNRIRQCFVAWVRSLREDSPEIVAIDGKTSRHTHDRGRNDCGCRRSGAPPSAFRPRRFCSPRWHRSRSTGPAGTERRY